jgi:hypothetical protein
MNVDSKDVKAVHIVRSQTSSAHFSVLTVQTAIILSATDCQQNCWGGPKSKIIGLV